MSDTPLFAEGSCVTKMDLSSMSDEEKLAYANVCHVVFPCQTS